MFKTAVLFNIIVKSRISFRIHCGTGSFSKKKDIFFHYMSVFVCVIILNHLEIVIFGEGSIK